MESGRNRRAAGPEGQPWVFASSKKFQEGGEGRLSDGGRQDGDRRSD